MDCFIGLDIGTSAVKGALLGADGKVLRLFQNKFTYFGENGARLLDPKEFCDTCFDVIGNLAETAREKQYHVAGVCSCCASGDLLLLDGNNEPITPVIGWQTYVDRSVFDGYFTEEDLKKIYNIVGWPQGNSMTPAWICYIRKNRKDIYDKIASVVMSAEYMNFCLTGKWGVAHSMGTPFLVIDQESGEYSKFILEKLGLEDKFFPPVYEKGTVLGEIKPETAEKLGLDDGTAVVLGSFDHPSGALGAGVFDEGDMLLSCGTSWVELFPVASREFAISTGGLVDRNMINGTPYCVMKSIASVSNKIDSMMKSMLGDISFEEFDMLAYKAPKGSNGLRFSLTDADHSLDLSKYSKSDIARAIIEGAAYILKDNLKEVSGFGLKADKVTMIGGISQSPECVEIISEILEKPISVINGLSAGAVGSCLLAGIGTGTFKDEKSAFAVMKSANAV